MPISKVVLFRSTMLSILVGLAALLSIVGMTLWLVGQAQTSTEMVYSARQQRSALADLRNLVQEAESSQRGFLLSGEGAYLAPYEEVRAKVPPQLERVRRLTSSEPGQAALLARLSTAIAGRLAEIDETVTLARSGRRDEALSIVRTDRGRELMETITGLLTTLVASAEDRVSTRLEEQRANISFLRWVTIVGALLILGVAAAIGWMAVVHTRQLTRAQRDIQLLNASLEERVEERTRDLGRANEEVQRFAYIVTHDLRAPLVNIMGFTSELETSIAPLRAFIEEASERGDVTVPEEARMAALEDLPEAVTFIRSSTRKMDGLINAILKLSREGKRTLKPERVDLDTFLRSAAESVRHQVVEAGGEVAIEGRVPPIRTDRLALEQVFGNLLDNAVKYRVKDRPLSIRIKSQAVLGNRIVVSVEDNGRGIAPSDHERVFDLFRRSGSQDQPGEGIGLAHVRTMVRNLGGDITVASELGRGTTFKVSLPQDLRGATGVA
jgi:signal transduction histidine kinase